MRSTIVSLVLIPFITLAALAQTSTAKKTSGQQSRAARGEYLVIIGGCHDCHTPKVKPGSMEPDHARLLSGRPATTPAPSKPPKMGEVVGSGDLTAWHGPWGVSYASNLTPHPTTGIGKRYNEASFIAAMRTGKKPEGEPLLPPMPWENFAKMSDSDLKAIWAYLKTLKPVDNFVRTAVVPAGGNK